MSNQNKKSRARNRQKNTGKKYTEALREQESRERTYDLEVPDGLISFMARESCNECGGEVRWVTLRDLRQQDPEGVDVLLASAGGEISVDSDAWVCMECSNFGAFGGLHVEGESGDFPLFTDVGDDADRLAILLNTCTSCGGGLDWVDPASVAMANKKKYMQAKEQFGVAILLEQGAATVCDGCSEVAFHPHGPPSW